MTRDFYSHEFDRLKIPDTVKALGSVETTQIEIRGICYRCSKKNNPKHCASAKEGEKMKKKLTNNAGAPVVDNQNIMTAGPRGPQLLQDVWFSRSSATSTGK